MRKHAQIPVALTIAGSDSGGGAGIQADLKVFAAQGVHGVTAVTCLTAQNPAAVLGVLPCDSGFLRKQLEAIFAELRPAAAKTGMLHSAALIREVARFLRRRRRLPLVVDPVIVSTSGARLLEHSGIAVLCSELLPLASLLTPNLDETEALAGFRPRSVEDMREAARVLQRRYGCAVLIKGGHLRGHKEAIDILQDGRQESLLSAPFIRAGSTHGTGCAYSAAITAGLARGLSLTQAAHHAKDYITRAIAGSRRIGRHSALASLPDTFPL